MYPCKVEGCSNQIKSLKNDGSEFESCFRCSSKRTFTDNKNARVDPSLQSADEVFGICSKDGCNETTVPMKSDPRKAYRYCNDCTRAGKFRFGTKNVVYHLDKVTKELLNSSSDDVIGDIELAEEDLDRLQDMLLSIRSFLSERKDKEPISKRRRTK